MFQKLIFSDKKKLTWANSTSSLSATSLISTDCMAGLFSRGRHRLSHLCSPLHDLPVALEPLRLCKDQRLLELLKQATAKLTKTSLSVPFFNYVRSQRIRRTRWSHKPTQRIKIFLLESREPAQRITITILLLPTQSATILLINHVSPHSTSRLLFFCYPPRTEQFSSFKHVSSYSASRLLFFFCYPPITHSFVAHTG